MKKGRSKLSERDLRISRYPALNPGSRIQKSVFSGSVSFSASRIFLYLIFHCFSSLMCCFLARRLLLEMFNMWPESVPFRDVADLNFDSYLAIIKVSSKVRIDFLLVLYNSIVFGYYLPPPLFYWTLEQNFSWNGTSTHYFLTIQGIKWTGQCLLFTVNNINWPGQKSVFSLNINP